MKKLAIAVLHYHLRPGGVTRVIERAVDTLKDEVNFLILSGEAPAPEAPLVPLNEPFSSLEYSHSNFENIKEKIDDLRFTARCLLGRDPDIWHIHNHSLGKNSFIPQLVRHLADDGCRLLLQPHDFAEDGRPENYRLLCDHLGDEIANTLYPSANHIFYAPINSRDKKLLKAVGIKNVHLLPNAVTPLLIQEKNSSTESRTFVYPARAIRRKNIGEFLLWSLLAEEGDKFISTLAPQNPTARPIYDEWVQFAQELHLPVEFDVGRKKSFEEIIREATFLITTSIAEGFGLAFLEPWLEGKELVGRNIPDITSDFEEEGLNLSTLYNRLPIPIDWIGKDEFKAKLSAAMKQSFATYAIAWKDEFLDKALNEMIIDETIDFGILDETMQKKVIRYLNDYPDKREMIPPLKSSSDQSLIHQNGAIQHDFVASRRYQNRRLN